MVPNCGEIVFVNKSLSGMLSFTKACLGKLQKIPVREKSSGESPDFREAECKWVYFALRLSIRISSSMKILTIIRSNMTCKINILTDYSGLGFGKLCT
jgi:hypothetical protein